MEGKVDMELWRFEGKEVTVRFIDGDIMSGRAIDFSSAEDNANGVDSICIGNIEIEEPEIASIEAITVAKQSLAVESSILAHH